MKVIGTAGHIDHGKSTLVHCLTGIDPDRLSEEKRRGMTIDLGFAWIDLPSGERASVVDVPGHERFVRNMLAGAAGIDVALLVVATDEGVMPQTREHLDILHLLGVRKGVIALTKIDAADPELIAIVAEEVDELVRGTTLEGSPAVPVSAVTGEGIERLLDALAAAVTSMPDRQDRGIPFVPVDRVFTVEGFGTVVTGTLHGGRLDRGGDVEIIPRGKTGRIRAIQSHGAAVPAAAPGDRVAINVAGIAREDVARGDLLARPGTVPCRTRFDARVTVPRDSPLPLRHNASVALHVGSAERPATVALLEGDVLDPGATGWAQIRLKDPVGLVRGQRFILRLPAPVGTVAGGEVVDVSPRHRRLDPEAAARLAHLEGDDLEVAALASLRGERPRRAEAVARSLGERVDRVEAALRRAAEAGRAVRLRDGYVTTASWDTLERRLLGLLTEYHAGFPLVPGMGREELRARAGVSRAAWSAVLDTLQSRRGVTVDGAHVALPGHRGGLESRRGDVEVVLHRLQGDPFSPPPAPDLLALPGVDRQLLVAMVEAGEIVRLGDDLYFPRAALQTAEERVVAALRERRELTVAEVRDLLGTSRKYALAILEFLDAGGKTRRIGDLRRLGPRAAECA